MSRRELVAQIKAVDQEDLAATKTSIVELVDAHPDILERTCRPGHLTGSALVVERGRGRILLMFHTKLQMWLQPGGHADGDPDLARVALREATEESGIAGLEVVSPALDLDIHEVNPPAEDPHLHLDVRYLVLAPQGAEPSPNHESEAMGWRDQHELAELGCDAGLERLASRGLDVALQIGAIE